MKTNRHTIEPLEARIAPAKLVGQVLTYTDLDGDHVAITISKGALFAGLFTFDTGFLDGDTTTPQQLQRIDLAFGGLVPSDGASITTKVIRAGNGDGFVNIGAIVDDNDLGSVTINGDLGEINAGDATTDTGFGLKSLSVRSLGRFGTATGGGPVNGDGTLESHITGGLGALMVKGDVANVWLHVTGHGAGDELHGTIGSITIGGSLIGGSTLRAGTIDITGDIGPVKIGRDIQGGTAMSAGSLQSDYGKIKSVTLGGSLLGSSATFTGEIRSGSDLGPVKIAGNVQGGAGAVSGFIASITGFGTAVGNIASLTIGGSVFGGAGTQSGQIQSPGDIGPVKIGGDVRGGSGDESAKIDAGGSIIPAGPATGRIASLTIGGSLTGGGGNYNTFLDGNGTRHEAQIYAIGDFGSVKIGGDMRGGAGALSGTIKSGSGTITGVSIGGSLIGGSRGGGTGGAGEIFSARGIGAVKIGRDLVGGTEEFCGAINVNFGDIASVTIGGSLIGGAGLATGYISTIGNIGAVKIGHDFVGGSISGSTTDLFDSGYISAFGRIASIFIGGSVISGIDDSTGGVLTKNASIQAYDDIGSLTVKGSLIGNVAANGATPVIITARGQNAMSPALTANKDVAIGKISIGGRVEYASILAGYDSAPAANNADAQIGAMKVGGDWIASSLVAGAQNSGNSSTAFTHFGDGNDAKISGAGTKDTSDTTLISKIASITIRGLVAGTPGGTDHFGFVAQQIGSFKAAGFTAILHSAAPPLDVIEVSLITADVTVREV